MLLASGELSKKVLNALQRLGVETIATDRYENAPGQMMAHPARTVTMSGPAQLKTLTENENLFIHLNASNKTLTVSSIPQ